MLLDQAPTEILLEGVSVEMLDSRVLSSTTLGAHLNGSICLLYGGGYVSFGQLRVKVLGCGCSASICDSRLSAAVVR